jgi:M6 family metalloprotease-like protein
MQAEGAPFDQDMVFTQPDGNVITIHGRGNDFYAEFTHAGYPIVFDTAKKQYDYAVLNEDGSALVSSGFEAGSVDPSTLGLDKDARISDEARKAQVKVLTDKWEGETHTKQRWEELKAERKAIDAAMAEGPSASLKSIKYNPIVQNKMGVTLLIDFPDEPATISAEQINNFLNGDNYSEFGNNGSVKQYYYDVSNQKLVYSNSVIKYVRMSHNKSYYNNTAKDAGTQAQMMIREAMDILSTREDWNTEIAAFEDSVTVNGENQIVAFNVLYTGDNGGVWSKGLWPHSSSIFGVRTLPGGKTICAYQCTNIGSQLKIGTFCHENGHMLCGFPDLYDYDYDSTGGGGFFCLMGGGNYGGPNNDGSDPVEVCAYLKYVAGWADLVQLDKNSDLTGCIVTVDHNNPLYNTFYCFLNPAAANGTEYYLIENRQQKGRDRYLLASGIAIWHVDELGDRDNQSLAYNDQHANYECTLMQADGKWDFENNRNQGDANDLFYQGNTAATYANAFTRATTPSSQWWDGSNSGLKIVNISTNGTEMTFDILPTIPLIITSYLPQGRVGTPYDFTLTGYSGTTSYVWSVKSGSLPDGLTLDEDSGEISGVPTVEMDDYITFHIQSGSQGSDHVFKMTIYPNYTLPIAESFSAPYPDEGWGWSQETGENSTNTPTLWTYQNGNAAGSGDFNKNPLTAYSAPYNAALESQAPANWNSVQLLVSPMLDFGVRPHTAQLSFWMYNVPANDSYKYLDRLTVLYKTSWEEDWTVLWQNKDTIKKWTKETITLPDPSRTYYIAFQGQVKNGYGIHIDDVWIGDPTPALAITNDAELVDGEWNLPYEQVITAIGGEPPYTFSLVDGTLPAGLSMTTNVISGVPTERATSTFTIGVTDSWGETTNKTFTLTVDYPRVAIFRENFETAGVRFPPAGWSQQYVVSNVSWFAQAYDDKDFQSYTYWVSKCEGTYSACLWWSDTVIGDGGPYPDHITRLISPDINLGYAPHKPRLTFWLSMQKSLDDQDELRVYYRTSATNDWTLIPGGEYTQSVTNWTKMKLELPQPWTQDYSLCFEGNARYGNGVHLDDIQITEASILPLLRTMDVFSNGWVGVSYDMPLEAINGTEPYVWSLGTGSLPDGLVMDPATGEITGTPTKAGSYTFDVILTDAAGLATTNTASILVKAGRTIPFKEGFTTGSLPSDWSIDGTLQWVFIDGSKTNAVGEKYPASAYSPSNNACLADTADLVGKTSKLRMPMLSFPSGSSNAVLSFMLFMQKQPENYQDSLYVRYRTSVTNDWTLLWKCTTNVTAWTQVSIPLPEPCATYFISFDGSTHAGFGVCVDDVAVACERTTTNLDTWIGTFFPGGYPGDDADSDGDGIPNIWEFIYGLDPTNAADASLGMTGGIIGDYLTISYRESKAAIEDGFQLDVVACTNLINAVWSTDYISQFAGSPADSNTWWQIIQKSDLMIKDRPRQFMRLRLTYPQ